MLSISISQRRKRQWFPGWARCFHMWRYPYSHHPFIDGDFPWNSPSSQRATPSHFWKTSSSTQLDLSLVLNIQSISIHIPNYPKVGGVVLPRPSHLSPLGPGVEVSLWRSCSDPLAPRPGAAIGVHYQDPEEVCPGQNPGHLSWSFSQELGDSHVADDTGESTVAGSREGLISFENQRTNCALRNSPRILNKPFSACWVDA